ncbi:hypothetical protein [Psychromonas aquatilis]|uniref:Uncharacterized protein n=1 Tax=Psychromonas aquatilis TaxID=2005072 RepID=A0ABU9GRN6_9GAMM
MKISKTKKTNHAKPFNTTQNSKAPSESTFNTSKLNSEDSHHHIGNNSSENIGSDTLTLAAKAGNEAKQAIKDKDYNKAWGLLSEQKQLYMKHSQAIGCSAQNALSLDSNVHENYANILRLENKHHDAFFHILYWVIASYHRPIQKHEQKLVAYFNRCKFKNTTIDDIQAYVKKHGPSLVNALEIKEQVKQWKDKG